MTQEKVSLARLKDQITWYDNKSGLNKKCFYSFKVVEVVLAALLPLLSGLNVPSIYFGIMGIAIVIIEGILNLFNFHQNWMTYRSTCEYLKHEKYLYEAKSGPYKDIVDPPSLLAERIEEIVSQEHAKWISETKQVKNVPRK